MTGFCGYSLHKAPYKAPSESSGAGRGVWPGLAPGVVLGVVRGVVIVVRVQHCRCPRDARVRPRRPVTFPVLLLCYFSVTPSPFLCYFSAIPAFFLALCSLFALSWFALCSLFISPSFSHPRVGGTTFRANTDFSCLTIECVCSPQ